MGHRLRLVHERMRPHYVRGRGSSREGNAGTNVREPERACIVHETPFPATGRFESFKPFTGVFPLEPWKPDVRQSAQQAMFLFPANILLTFLENVASHKDESGEAIARFTIPNGMRNEVLERLAIMNVTAATLFPDLGGLARSLRTLPVRRPTSEIPAMPWTRRSL